MRQCWVPSGPTRRALLKSSIQIIAFWAQTVSNALLSRFTHKKKSPSLPVHMTQGLPRKFLHPRRCFCLYWLHIQFLNAGLFSQYLFYCSGVMLQRRMAGLQRLQGKQQTKLRKKNEPTRKATIQQPGIILSARLKAQRRKEPGVKKGGIKRAVRLHPPPTHLLPGVQ